MLHTVGYKDGGKVRPILYRASLSEMIVPYGDPTDGHFRKNAFDVGECGIGLQIVFYLLQPGGNRLLLVLPQNRSVPGRKRCSCRTFGPCCPLYF